MTTYYKTINSPIGFLKLVSDEHRLKSILFVDDDEGNSPATPGILEMSALQVKEYFEGTRFRFNLDMEIDGTRFQQKVWRLIKMVNYGKTSTYGDIARQMKSLGCSRAVGMANARNPLPIIIPCHRILGNDGKLVGYSGGIEKKKWLLVHEEKYSGSALFF